MCFDKIPLQNGRESDENRTAHVFQLKETLHCTPGLSLIVNEQGFDRETLIKSGGTTVSGRALNVKALTVAANFKHALEFANDHTQDTGGEQNPSGAKHGDLLFCVCQQMFVKFQGARDQKGFSRANKDQAKKFKKKKKK